MIHIRPISDLRNNFTEISRLVHEENEPVYLTKNGHGDMVVMSLETYEKKLMEKEINYKLQEAAAEAESTYHRYNHEDVMSEMRKMVDRKKKN